VKKFAALKIQPDRVFKLSFEIGEEMMAKLLSHKTFDEFRNLSQAEEFMSGELGIKVAVQRAGANDTHDPAGRAKDALPTKPAFYLE